MTLEWIADREMLPCQTDLIPAELGPDHRCVFTAIFAVLLSVG